MEQMRGAREPDPLDRVGQYQRSARVSVICCVSVPGKLTRAKPDLRTVTRALAYLVGSICLLYPVLSTPVIADDFLNPFSQTADGGSGLPAAVAYGWRGSTEGGSFRIVGTTVGSAFNWLWLAVSADLDISMATIYAVTKFVILIMCAASLAGFWRVASREHGRGISFWNALVITSLALFGTLQLHGLWSNDPVGSYPLAGYASAALGFAVLTCAVLANRRESWGSFALGTAVALVAVAYYEINIGAVLGSAVILAIGCWMRRKDHRSLVMHLTRSAIFLGVPALLVLYGRTVNGSNTVTYGGTEIRLSGAPRAFALGVVGSMPGAAWRLSDRQLGGRLRLVFLVFGIATFLALLLKWWAQTSDLRTESTSDNRQRPGQISVVLAVVIYACFAIGLQAITEKVQDEMLSLGYVYTFYAMTSCAIALGLAVAGQTLYLRRCSAAWRILLAAGAVSFLVIQSTVNWRLSEKMNVAYSPNVRLLNSFDGDVGSARRCQALDAWSAIPWPAYYREGMTDGLDKAYRYYFGEPFCPGVAANG